MALANRAAQTSAGVLITGESGTGKEKLAHFIHKSSDRKDKPFIAVNCAAIPENMLEAMLFGFNKGPDRFLQRSAQFALDARIRTNTTCSSPFWAT